MVSSFINCIILINFNLNIPYFSYRLPLEFSFCDIIDKKFVEDLLPCEDMLWGYIKHSCWLECKWFQTDDLELKCRYYIFFYIHNIVQLSTKSVKTSSFTSILTNKVCKL